jgi:predicted flap endonuclease-1-like 5' DNA nuclease
MYYLLATYWMWFVVALLAGGAIGYWSSRRWASEGWARRWPWWAVIAFVVGLVVAILHGLPGRAGLYLETLLLLSFWYAIGGLLGIWLGKATSHDVPLTANATEDVRPATAAKTEQDARLAAAAKTAEDARKAAAAKVAQDARLAAAAKATEEARQAPAAKVTTEAVRPTATAATMTPPPSTPTQHPGTRPQGIAAPEGGHADDLKLIKGIGPKNEKISNALGVYHIRQIANWTPGEAIWVGHHMAFPGRIEREHWIPQAKLLASGGDTDHSAGVKSGTIIVDDSADAPLDAAAADALANSLPEQAGTVEDEARHAGRRPYGLAAPLGGQPDDLKRIRGIGPQNEGRLHGLGIWHFTQIRAWSAENVKWVGSYLAFPGRIDREKWVDQARELAAGHETEFSRRVAAGKVATSKDDGSHGQGNVQIVK